MIQVYGVALIPLIIGLIELMKRFGLTKKLAPLIALLLGIIAGVFYVNPYDIKGGIVVGLMMGLSASGLYSGTKSTFAHDINNE